MQGYIKPHTYACLVLHTIPGCFGILCESNSSACIPRTLTFALFPIGYITSVPEIAAPRMLHAGRGEWIHSPLHATKQRAA